MGPMTRSRASIPEDPPNELMDEYYGQRSTAGLTFTEAIHISPNAVGYTGTPGIWSDSHEDWLKVTELVQTMTPILPLFVKVGQKN